MAQSLSPSHSHSHSLSLSLAHRRRYFNATNIWQLFGLWAYFCSSFGRGWPKRLRHIFMSNIFSQIRGKVWFTKEIGTCSKMWTVAAQGIFAKWAILHLITGKMRIECLIMLQVIPDSLISSSHPRSIDNQLYIFYMHLFAYYPCDERIQMGIYLRMDWNSLKRNQKCVFDRTCEARLFGCMFQHKLSGNWIEIESLNECIRNILIWDKINSIASSIGASYCYEFCE